jgi:hypothetical protein
VGSGGADRVELTWANNTIVDEWIQVTVLADANTGLAAADVFYFGNCPGDANGDQGIAFSDLVSIFNKIGTTPTASASARDANRDGNIAFSDLVAAFNQIGKHSLTLLAAPTSGPSMPAATTSVASAASAPAADATAGPNAASSAAPVVVSPASAGAAAVDGALAATVRWTWDPIWRTGLDDGDDSNRSAGPLG